MKRYQKLTAFFILFAGFLACLMVTMMHLGGGIDLDCFLGTERVYDFPEEDLQKESSGWVYDAGNGTYSLIKKKALNKYYLNGKKQTWKCLYLTLDHVGEKILAAKIYYYNKSGDTDAIQEITLAQGENIVFLYEDVSMYRMGIMFAGEEGASFSIESMQLRSEVSGYTRVRFLKAIGVSYGIFLALYIGILIVRKKWGFSLHIRWDYRLRKALQSIYIVVGDSCGKSCTQKVGTPGRRLVRRILLGFLFLWMVFFPLMGWSQDENIYRYFVLIVAMLLLGTAGLCWEKPLRMTEWKNPIATAWLMLWLLVIISDIFASRGNKFIGYVMLFAGGLVIFVWNQMEKPYQLARDFMIALEVDFVPVVLFCMFCRQKKMTVYYNGIFRLPEEFAVYSLAMFALFLTELCWLYGKKKGMVLWVLYGSGAAIALYFVIRSGGMVAMIALAMIGVLYLGKWIGYYRTHRKLLGCHLKNSGGRMAVALIISLAMAFLVHVSVSSLPEEMQTDITFEDEQLISTHPSEVLALYQEALPGELDNVVSWDTLKINVYQKNYARLLNLFGHMNTVSVYREEVQSYSGYLTTMYRYGIFAVLPLLMFQVYSFIMAVKYSKVKGTRDGNIAMWMLAVDCIMVCFCVLGNAGVDLEYPLFIWYYLLNGMWFGKSLERKKGRKHESESV